MILRDYQHDAAMAAFQSFDAGNKSVLLVLATGLGKTIIFCKMAEHFVNLDRGRVLMIEPTIELVRQTSEKVHAVTGEFPAIEQANLWSNEDTFTRSNFIVACKPSLTAKMPDGRKRYERLEDIGLVIVDEAHHAATSQCKEMLDYFDCLKLCVTATPNRHDEVALGEICDDAPYIFDIRKAIDLGWLVSCATHCVQLRTLDLSSVETYGKKGDFKLDQLGKAMSTEEVVFEIAEITARESGNLKTLVFCASVDEAMKVAGVLQDVYHLKADWVCGDKNRCPDDKRRSVLDSFKNDADGVQFVCNVGVLTTGFDHPGVEHIVMARPTKSLTLFTQIFGRGTRPLPGIVDFDGSEPETRKARIAQSQKPRFKFTDLRDVSLQHKLVTPLDVLGGRLSIEEREAANRILEGDDAKDIDEVIKEATEEVRVREEAERRRLAAIRAKADYTTILVDPFMEGVRVVAGTAKERGARMPFGKHKGSLVRDLPEGYLHWFIENMPRKPKLNWLFVAMEKQIEGHEKLNKEALQWA
jgi:superfamily II DNA or RNA helicase/uncharacterized protein (DUF3820 family)